MKNLRILAIALVTVFSLNSCSKDDNPTPVIENEVITTVTTTLTAGERVIILTSRDIDGDGPNDPIVTVSGSLTPETTYSGTVTFLNETVSPAEDITTEIKELGIEHQLFFQAPSTLGTFAYADFDAKGNPIGLQFTLVTAAAATENLLVTLKHEPNKLASGISIGDFTNAGGSTDSAVTYRIVVALPR